MHSIRFKFYVGETLIDSKMSSIFTNVLDWINDSLLKLRNRNANGVSIFRVAIVRRMRCAKRNSSSLLTYIRIIVMSTQPGGNRTRRTRFQNFMQSRRTDEQYLIRKHAHKHTNALTHRTHQHWKTYIRSYVHRNNKNKEKKIMKTQ